MNSFTTYFAGEKLKPKMAKNFDKMTASKRPKPRLEPKSFDFKSDAFIVSSFYLALPLFGHL